MSNDVLYKENMMIKEYKDDEQLLARHIPAAEAWKDGLNFFSQDQEYVQVKAPCA
jgi:hypothetical protein